LPLRAITNSASLCIILFLISFGHRQLLGFLASSQLELASGQLELAAATSASFQYTPRLGCWHLAALGSTHADAKQPSYQFGSTS
jgi:hypothetical protein